MAIMDLCSSKTCRNLVTVKCDLSTDQSFKEGFRISTFSKRQQRKMKIFLLKASRPILRRSNHKSSQVTSPSRSPSTMDAPKKEEESTAETLPLLALEAMEEARILRRMQSINESPLDSAFGAVDWMLDLAHGVQYDWPMFTWLKDDSMKKVTSPRDYLETCQEEEVEVELEIGTEYPRCEWPRKTLVSKVGLPETVEAARCSWPRSSDGLTFDSPVKEEIVMADRNFLEKIFASESNLGNPHCAWPRSNGVVRASGARCAWPRKIAVSATENIIAFVTEDSSDIEDESDDEVVSARCAWPRAIAVAVSPPVPFPTASDTVVGPRCAWPRTARSVASGGEFSTGDSIAMNINAETVPGPRCLWPRKQQS